MGDEKPHELYSCNGCSEKIPTDRARVACLTCPDYHLCANCFVIKQSTKPHIESHSTTVFKLSGFVVPAPPGIPPRPAAPAVPPRRSSIANSRQTVRTSEIPTANWGALWNIMKAPLEKMDKKNRKNSVSKDDDSRATRGRSSSMMTGALDDKGKDHHKGNDFSSPLSQNPVGDLPPSPPKSPPKSAHKGMEQIDSSVHPYSRPATWEPLFGIDGTPTPVFVALMSTIFGRLDPEHSGFLRPETYSAFLDLQGYDLNSNSWKKILGDDTSDSSKDIADLELSLYFSDNDISHKLNVRTKTPISQASGEEPTSAVEKRIRQSISFKPNMPMLSRQGFIDLTAIEYLKDPDKAYQYLLRAIQEYRIWKGLGEPPRAIFPDHALPEDLQFNASGAGEAEEGVEEVNIEVQEEEGLEMGTDLTRNSIEDWENNLKTKDGVIDNGVEEQIKINPEPSTNAEKTDTNTSKPIGNEQDLYKID
ncbi:hypothetical protein EG329_012697 [Mollisiaceae sp. DMI_Dod_QoI]|nr:hypothetical protein EG329_012697 [Helotiales sp. DMI_Dod_QoI]